MTRPNTLFQRFRHIVLYAALMAAMVFLLKWLEWKYFIADYSMELYVGIVAVAFTALGLWIATQLSKPKVQQVIVEKEVYVTAKAINEAELNKLDLGRKKQKTL